MKIYVLVYAYIDKEVVVDRVFTSEERVKEICDRANSKKHWGYAYYVEREVE